MNAKQFNKSRRRARRKAKHPGFTKEDRELFMKAIARKGGLHVRF